MNAREPVCKHRNPGLYIGVRRDGFVGSGLARAWRDCGARARGTAYETFAGLAQAGIGWIGVPHALGARIAKVVIASKNRCARRLAVR